MFKVERAVILEETCEIEAQRLINEGSCCSTKKKMFNPKNISLLVLAMFSALNALAQNERSLIRDGNKQYNQKKYSDAELNYRKGLEKNDHSYEANYNLGNALYRQDKLDEAAKYYSGSAALNKDKAAQQNAYYNLGNSLLKANKYQESVEAYKNSLKLNPKDEQSRYNLSYALSKLRQQQQQQQNKNDKNKDNKDQKQNKQQQQQDQKKQDEKKDQQQQQQDQKQQADNKQQQQPKPKISKEDAERMLQALKNDEKNLQKKLAKKFDASTGNPEKDW